VEYLADDRQQGSLDGYYQGLSEEQRQGIEAVAMDIWDPYIASTRGYVPEAEEKIVFDRYHLMTHIGKAVDTRSLGGQIFILDFADIVGSFRSF
jgi:transposase